MIEARKNRLIEFFFSAVNRRMVRHRFSSHLLTGEAALKNLKPGVPVLLYANHSNWWDGLMAFHLSHDIFRHDAVLMMEEKQLMRYRFFIRIGAFGVNRDHALEARSSLLYAVDQVRRGRVLWIYPQGVLAPNDTRPLTFYHGLARIAHELGHAYAVPVAHRYEFLGEELPFAFTRIGTPRELHGGGDYKSWTPDLARQLTELLDGLRADIIGGRIESFHPTLRGRVSIHRWYDRIRGIESA